MLIDKIRLTELIKSKIKKPLTDSKSLANVIGNLSDILVETINIEQPNNVIWYISDSGNIIEPVELDFGDGVTIISNDYSDKGTITFSGDVTKIGDRAFYQTDLVHIDIPSTVTELGISAFMDCDYLKSIDLPEALLTISDGALASCKKLDSLFIPKNVSYIGVSNTPALSDADGLNKISVDPDNTTYDSRENCNAIINTSSNVLIAGCSSTRVPVGVVKVGDYAFHMNDGLKYLRLPEGVESIGYDAFNECINLEFINLPKSLTTINSYAFNKCHKLTYIKLHEGLTTLDPGTFSECSELSKIDIPSTVIVIEESLFSDCINLSKVTLPSTIETIKSLAFTGCSKLESIKFKGTKDEWNAIEKEDNWSSPELVIIHCIDGDIEL